ncbi:MAG: glycine betaine/L-proline ABC transporter ATP-binding protein ProV [Rhodocyclaceae bacterium]|nr:glycine betaine/L-proline ABC transporter ATP-binding protein ProV [Rhodocyclaceae bacterium]
MQARLVVRNLYKVFGDQPDRAMALVREGADKNAIFERTGQTLGVIDANFEVREGEIFVVMGLSGSGKSTLVRLLNRLIEPSAGQVLFDGRDIAAMDDEALRQMRRRHISMVFQSFALMPHLSVLDNTAFGLMLAGEDEASRRQRAQAALAQVGLARWADSFPDELSGGMQQRVGLARALASDPDVLLMDEAFSALDPLIRTEMQDELVKLQAAHRRTIVFISHDLDEAIRIGDRIAIMEGGRVIQVGTAEEILRAPANDYVRSFFRGVDATRILSARDLARRTQVNLIDHAGMGVRSALERLRRHDRDYGYVVSAEQTLMGMVSVETLGEALRTSTSAKLQDAFVPDLQRIAADVPISELYDPLARHPYGLPVVDADGRYLGTVTRNAVLEFLHRNAPEACP